MKILFKIFLGCFLIPSFFLACKQESLNFPIEKKIIVETPEMISFKLALKSLANPENRISEIELYKARINETETISNKRLDIMFEPSKRLIKSGGFSDYEIFERTKGDKSLNLNWASSIYIFQMAYI